MTLLDDLQSLDLSAVVSAKGDIQLTVDADDLQSLLGSGAAASVLGDIGTALEAVVAAVDDPEHLLDPLVAVLLDVLERIGAEVDLGDYVEAVADAARLVAGLVGMLAGDPNRIGFGDLDVGDALSRVTGGFGDHAAVVTGGIARARALIETVENGLPSDPGELASVAIELLVPVPTGAVDAARAWAGAIGTRLDRVAIDPHLTDGLVNALARVRIAAEAGDGVELQASLTALAQVREATVLRLAEAMRAVAGTVSGIRVGTDGLASLHDLRAALASADRTVLDQLDDWREMIAGVRAMVEDLDAAEALARLEEILDQVETKARELLGGAIDDSVEAVRQWLRDLLREIPLRPLRARVSEAIAAAASAIADADLDAPVATLRSTLTEVSRVLDEADPAALVQAAVTRLEDVVRDALDALEDALGRITGAIEAVADQAAEILGRAVDGVRTFREAIDEVTAAIEDAGIAEAGQDIAATLGELREQVSELLSSAPLPDALREPIGQLISTLEQIDLDAAIGGPLREVAARLQIPAEVADATRDGLQAVADAVDAVVPDAVIADLEGMLDGLLAEIESLDLSSLTSGISGVLDGAADAIEEVSVTELAAPVGAVFAQIVDAVDRVHPRVLLRPAIDLYGQLMGAVPVPSADTITTRAAAVTSQAGEAAARAAAEPARRLVDAQPNGGDADPAPEDPPEDLRPGDIVRLVGFLPARLREALAGLDTGPAGEVIGTVDALLGGTATMLLDVRDRVVTLEETARAALDGALAPLAAAQIDAQLALRGSAAVSAGGIELEASLGVVATAGPGSVGLALQGERDLVAGRALDAASSLTGRVADDLAAAAAALTAVLPSGLLDDLDGLLAALDPEPLAAELDALLAAIVDATPGFLAAGGDALTALLARVSGLIEDFGPGKLMQRYLGILDVIRDELALLDPGRLADELAEVHAEIKAAVLAYDPLVLAADLDGLIAQVAAAIRGLDPAHLIPDLSGLAAQVARLEDILPVNALAGVGTQLTAVGAELRALDVGELVAAVNSLAPETADAVSDLIDAVRDEIVALLQSIRYGTPSGSASVSVSAGVST